MFEHEKTLIQKEFDQFAADRHLQQALLGWRGLPFSGEWGLALPFFPVAAADPRKSLPVPLHAQNLAEAFAGSLSQIPGISRVQAVKGYVNLYFSTPYFAKQLVEEVRRQGNRFGYNQPAGKPVMVEYSNPNTHKPLHVGHLRNMILGGAVCNLLEASGRNVIRANYIGDIGLHVIKWMCNYETYHQGEEPSADKMRWMSDIYTEADRRFSDEPGFEEKVRAYFSRWDAQDPDVIALWEKTRAWSMEGMMQVYELMGYRFDRIYFESEVEDSGKDVVHHLISSGLAQDGRPENPVIINLDELLGTKEEYRVVVILRSDGSSLYATKEIPLAVMKFEEYGLAESIYVIDVRQSLHMKQMAKVLELMGYPWASQIHHLAYEIVNLPGNVTMSSRDGTVVLLDDLVREATERALSVVREKNPTLPQESMLSIAREVALGAIKYPMISRENTKIVTFDWQTALDFEGQSAPYIQYAAVRAKSILRKAAGIEIKDPHYDYLLSTPEVNLIEKISKLPDEIQRAAKELKPSLIAVYAYELARIFNDFYNQCKVLGEEPKIQNARLALVDAARIALEEVLVILGIKAPQLM
ncbi:MAG: arginine--tRNA ligase [Anaerolineaceae bacterium]|nr:arginine--tRNA ligase [Anaerolineaceae bacterium]